MKYNPRQLHLQFNIDPANIKITVITKYNSLLRQWEFVTWKCWHCTATLKHVNTIAKHHNTCKQLNTTKRKNK